MNKNESNLPNEEEVSADFYAPVGTMNFYDRNGEVPIGATTLPDELLPFENNSVKLRPTKRDLLKLEKSQAEYLEQYKEKLRRQATLNDNDTTINGDLTIGAENRIDDIVEHEKERVSISAALNLFKKDADQHLVELKVEASPELKKKIERTLKSLKQIYPTVYKNYPSYIENIRDSETEQIFDNMLNRFYDVVARQEKMDEFKDEFNNRIGDKNHTPTDIESQAHNLFKKDAKVLKAKSNIGKSFSKVKYAFQAFFAALRSDYKSLRNISEQVYDKPTALDEVFSSKYDLKEVLGLR